MLSDSRLMSLPIALIDVSPVRSERRSAVPVKHVDDNQAPARRLSRRSRLAAAVQANIVRLVPGATLLPFDPAPR
jgi:hypothetical protein